MYSTILCINAGTRLEGEAEGPVSPGGNQDEATLVRFVSSDGYM